MAQPAINPESTQIVLSRKTFAALGLPGTASSSEIIAAMHRRADLAAPADEMTDSELIAHLRGQGTASSSEIIAAMHRRADLAAPADEMTDSELIAHLRGQGTAS
ncbi:MAG: hypothetical protein OSB43_18135 [Nocardioides sp.]|uniref:hypothetical protein n=1 Tax=Nocardioides sp. TaxID=35761 RepID=UPI0023950D99|nr:hypothetical protein [Nocardioides sp.]MDE0778204.1 hypothetical protein [Nocardioides sp.]